MKRIRIMLLGLGSTALCAVAAHGATENFDTVGGFDNNFNESGSLWVLSEANSIGLSGTRAVNVQQNGGTQSGYGTGIYKTGVDGLSGTISVFESVYFRWVTPGSSGNLSLQLGLTPSNDIQFATSAGAATFVSAGILNSVSGPYLEVRENTFGGTSSVLGDSGNILSLTSGNWYYFTGDFSLTNGNYIHVTASLWNSDSAGATGTLVRAFSAIVTNNSVYSAGTLYGGFRAGGTTAGGYGIDVLDNYSIGNFAIPEPSVATLFYSGLSVLAFVNWRRK